MSKRMRDEDIVINDNDVVDRSPVEVPKEYWATNSPYIDAYIRALNYANYDPIETEFTSYEDEGRPVAASDRPGRPAAAVAPSKAQKNKKPKKAKAPKFYKKRKFPLALLALLMIAMVAVAALGIVGPISKYTASFVFNGNDGLVGVSMFDPVYSLIKGFMGTEEEAAPAAAEDTATGEDETTGETIVFSEYYKETILDQYKDYDAENAKTEVAMQRIIHYAFPIIILLFLLSCVYILIKTLVALFSKKSKKYKLGFAWFTNFLLLAGIVIGGMVWNGLGIGELKSFFMSGFLLMEVEMEGALPASVVGMGLGLYIHIILAVVSLFMVMFGYKKLKPGQTKAVAKKKKQKA